MSRRALAAIAGAAVVVTVAGVAAAATMASGGSGTDPGPPRSVSPAARAAVKKQTLVNSSTVQGELGFGDAVPLDSKATGTVTWLPPVGATIGRGETLFRSDERPIVLLYGRIPMYRELSDGLEGKDVRQFEENLRALGYKWFTVDDEFSSYTERAVERWQEDLGVEETGKVAVGQVVYAPDTIRIAEQKVRIGAASTGEVLGYTSRTKSVVVDAAATDLEWATRGAEVDVVLPDGTQVPAVVQSIGTEASGEEESPGGESGPATVEVAITIADQPALRKFEKAPVEVRYTSGQRKDVLTVPVPALLALADDGYGLEVVEGKRTRLTSVETGMFADGRVEVRGEGITEGVIVGMPK